MSQNKKPTSILDSLGEEIIRIITPVSICMFLVVLLVSILNSSPSDSSSNLTSIATIAYNENTSDSFWDKFTGALLNSLVFVVVITVVTFILVFLFYVRCTKCLKYYMGFSSFVVLGFMGGEVAVILIREFSIPIDGISFLLILFNFTVVGVLAIFMSEMAILIKQGYLVIIGVLVAFCFSLLPEWTTWAVLVALALYDLAAVLLPGGPLRLLVELAMSRDEEIPALVYEARPVTYNDSGRMQRVVDRRSWRGRHDAGSDTGESSNANPSSSLESDPSLNSTLGVLLSSENRQNVTRLVIAEEGRSSQGDSELLAPLVEHQLDRSNVNNGTEEIVQSERWPIDGIGLGSSGAIKLGLGDFIFYSVLVGRAAMYDLMTVYACYLAIIAGLGITLMLLAIYQKALPALPVSILLGVLFYFLTRLSLEAFVVQCSVNLLMF
ncbi:Presenilin-like protein [Thalictrum thalictroides]|uniref:Presenilin n=1 Tax=Thalictrum thalictroides TaxID=46969 RepID=A0A7J6V5K0_THATH|nr:Presenilin-like protein [Thalictrum thalictroides]